MAFHFCPQCGTKLQPDFKFCPSCGEKLPCPEVQTPSPSRTYRSVETFTTVVQESPSSTSVIQPNERAATASLTKSPVSARPPLRKTTRNSLRLDNLSIKDVTSPTPNLSKFALENATEVDKGLIQATPPKKHFVAFQTESRVEALESSPSAVLSQNVRGSAKRKAVVPVEEAQASPLTSPITSPNSKSPAKGKGKSKKTKLTHALEPLQEGTEVTDTTGKVWKMVQLLSQGTTEIIYEAMPSNTSNSDYILKLGAKDGKIFNEQNFLQRAAKPASIEKWIKQNKMNFLGVPQCIGFGLHADSYRFLIFPSMGQSLLSLMDRHNRLLSELTVLQLASRLLDVLLYIHSNEYVHADINAENIFIKEGHASQVYLVGYNHAFRYCPGGRHVELREGSRTPHEGAVEFISLDSHSGAAPSRRSDLQSLGYCLLFWNTGTLPWSSLSQPQQVAADKKKYMKDVPSLLNHCFGTRKVSRALESFLSEVMALEYNEQPDYAALKSDLDDALAQLGGSVEQPISF